jgi:hypothetical protein
MGPIEQRVSGFHSSSHNDLLVYYYTGSFSHDSAFLRVINPPHLHPLPAGERKYQRPKTLFAHDVIDAVEQRVKIVCKCQKYHSFGKAE